MDVKLKGNKALAQAQNELMSRAIMVKTIPLIRSALSVALGNIYVYKYDAITKKKALVTDPAEIELALAKMDVGGVDTDGIYYYITTDKPDMDAIDKLFNRVYGKPKEIMKVEGELDFAGSLRQLALDALKRKQEIKDIDARQIADDIATPPPTTSQDL